jgi:cellulose synthase/poly-beta-1,6-N-acetylglucosamine synthase-like glycosyltransferase
LVTITTTKYWEIVMEFIRQMHITLATGEWTIFQTYVVFVWTMMLPRMVGAGIFYSFRPVKPTHLNLRYMFEVALAFTAFGWVWYQFALSHVSIWILVLVNVVAILFVAAPLRRKIVRFLFQKNFYAKHVRVVKQTGSHEIRKSVALITIYEEKPKFLAECLKKMRHSFEVAGGEFTMIALVDGCGEGRSQLAEADIAVALQYCDIVMTSDAKNKRLNLRALYRVAEKRGLVGDETIIHLIDSDTLPANARVASELIRPFKDPTIGGVTTMQMVWKPKSFWEHMSQIFEIARAYSSMACMSQSGNVGCMPGRWYAVRASCLSSALMDTLATDSFSYFGFLRRTCTAGDDRCITNFVLQQRKRTIMNPEAVVYTDAPDNLKQLHSMWVRWGRSSQGYTLRSPWLFYPRFWPIAFVYWGDIFLSFSTVFITLIHWPYVTLFGDSLMIPLWESLGMALLSMTMIMTIRQLPTLLHHPLYILYMFLFGFVAIFAHVCRVEAFFTQHKIGKWGTRAGADDNRVTEPSFSVIYEKDTDRS